MYASMRAQISALGIHCSMHAILRTYEMQVKKLNEFYEQNNGAFGTNSHKIRMQIPQANIFARAGLRWVECIRQYCLKLFGNVRDKVFRM